MRFVAKQRKTCLHQIFLHNDFNGYTKVTQQWLNDMWATLLTDCRFFCQAASCSVLKSYSPNFTFNLFMSHSKGARSGSISWHCVCLLRYDVYWFIVWAFTKRLLSVLGILIVGSVYTTYLRCKYSHLSWGVIKEG